MADRTIATNEAAIAEAAVVQDSLVDSFLRLFDGTLVPEVTTTKAQMVAKETTLTGYPVGGYDIAAFTGPLLVSGGGAVITSPVVSVAYASGAEATIGGGWIEDAGGDVRRVLIFDPPRPLAVVGNGFDVIRQLLYGRNTA